MNEELENIEAEVKRKKGRWKAGETSISRLSPEERKKRLGLNLPDDEESGTENSSETPEDEEET